MSRQNIASPLTVLLAGVIVIVMLLVGGDPPTAANNRAQDQDYPAQTALAETATAAAYLAPSSASQATALATAEGTEGTVTPTLTGTVEATVTVQPGQRTPTTTVSTATPESFSEFEPPTITPTPTPSNEVACVPGAPIEISGVGPPRAAYLIYFGQRAVGGGSVEPDGTFLAKLTLGLERAGEYDVVVRVRGTQQVLHKIKCLVPATTPTPLPNARPAARGM